MKNKLLLLLALSIVFLAGCRDKHDPEPPTIDKIVGQYSGGNLKATIDGISVSEGISVQVIQKNDNTTSFKLFNIVPGYPEFEVPNVTFEALSRAYYSQLKGSVTDNVSGYAVLANAHVEDEIMEINIAITEIEGVPTSAESFYNKTFKGEMAINLGVEPVTMTQRVYVSKPSNKNPNQLRLRIENFSFQGVYLGVIQLDTVSLVKRGDVYGFTAKDRELSDLEIPGVTGVKLTARGAIIEDHIMKLNLEVGASPLTIHVTFTGDTITESVDTKINLTIEGNAVAAQPDNSKTASIYVFKVWETATASQLKLTPKIELPKGATLDSIVVRYSDGIKSILKEGEAIDFSKIEGEKYDVRYYITSEDVRYHSTKTLRLEKMPEFKSTYKMNSWITPQGKDYQEPMNMASSNMAADFFPLSGMMIGHALTAKPYPVSQDEDAAKIITRDTYGGYIAFMSVVLPKVTAGTLFNGTFELDTKAPLKSTHFGEAYRGTAAPVAFKFTYKYPPGPTYFNTIVKTEGSTTTVTAEKVPGKVDECSLIAYLYEVDSYGDYLDGTNINSSEKVILKAAFSSGAQDSFTEKTVNFEPTGNGSFDPANKKYKIAIVCTPSKEGDAYNGAPDSALWIKSLEITY